MRIPWYVAALLAAIIWGVHYPLLGQALKRISLVSILFLTAIPFLVIGAVFYRQLLTDWEIFKGLHSQAQFSIGAIAFTSTLASILLLFSISHKNALLASLLEISYPLFVALFSYLLFREASINTQVILGAVLIFAGVILIVWRNP